MAYHEAHPENWRDCFHYIHEHYGYDKYAGNCHIIPNIAVMILSLLYGEGDFTNTLCICTLAASLANRAARSGLPGATSPQVSIKI